MVGIPQTKKQRLQLQLVVLNCSKPQEYARHLNQQSRTGLDP